MNKENEKEKKPNSSLMRKTKSQLIDIILRKDSIEKELRDNIKTIENNLSNLETAYKYEDNKLKLKNKNYELLKESFETTCDEYTSQICKLNEYITYKNFIISILSVVSILTSIGLFYTIYF